MTIPLQRASTSRQHLMRTGAGDQDSLVPEVSGPAAWLLALVTGVAVYGLASFAYHLRPEGSALAAWWPAAGVAVAAIALVAPRERVLVALAVGAGALASNLGADRPWTAQLGFATANALTPLIWVIVMTWRRDARPQLLTADDFGRFVLATLASTGIAGLVAGTAAQVTSVGNLFTIGGAFAATLAASVFILVPFVLPLPATSPRPRTVEATAQAVALACALFVVYHPDQDLPISVLPLPFLLWAAVRLPARWVTGELLVAGVLTCVLTTLGYGPYAAVTEQGSDPEIVGLLLQLALVVYAMATLPLTLLVNRQTAALASARESYELVQNVLTGATGTAIIGCDRDGTITVFNTGAEQMLGYSAEEVVGRCTPERFHLREELVERAAELGVQPGWDVFTAAVDNDSRSDRRDWTMVRKDGTRLTASVRLTAQRSADGELAGFLGVGEDVTERRRTEKALRDALERERDALERLEQLDKAKTTFVSSVSHELRTPMTSILGYTDMVLDETAGPVTREQRGMLEATRRNGRRLLRLIEDLLTVSLIEDGSFGIDVAPVDLCAAAHGALEAVRPLLSDRQLELRVDADGCELMVVGDLDHLERVAINLLANAVKFTPDGGRIDVRLRSEQGNAVLEVTDTGIGIPEHEQSQLFERFYRTTNAQELEVPGTGLGLSIVRSIVVSHGGEVDVRSRMGAGTTFRVAIPLRQTVDA